MSKSCKCLHRLTLGCWGSLRGPGKKSAHGIAWWQVDLYACAKQWWGGVFCQPYSVAPCRTAQACPWADPTTLFEWMRDEVDIPGVKMVFVLADFKKLFHLIFIPMPTVLGIWGPFWVSRGWLVSELELWVVMGTLLLERLLGKFASKGMDFVLYFTTCTSQLVQVRHPNCITSAGDIPTTSKRQKISILVDVSTSIVICNTGSTVEWSMVSAVSDTN